MNIPAVPRRQFLITAMAAGAGSIIQTRLFAQHEGDQLVQQIRAAAAEATISAQSLRSGISVLIGSGGNIAVLSGRDGKLIVDAGIPGRLGQIEKALASISAEPPRYLVNTHWHFDHTDGNQLLHAAGATIIGHENTRKHMSRVTRVQDWNFTFPAAPADAWPTILFASDHKLQMNGTTVVLEHYRPAHTDSDISVRFMDGDVLHVGDTWWNGVYPFIDYSTGGSIDGTIRAAEANIDAASGSTIVIPGHGPVGDRSGLIEFRDMLVAIRDRVYSLKKQGRSVDDVVAAKPTAKYDAKWASLVPASLFTRLVYAGV
jgi:glyoxylase-like metal-dependent hydrolase (beta-lactamase superfamily II)